MSATAKPSTLRQVAILIGGAGSRLGALTGQTPKPMLSVAGKPFLEHLLVKARRHGLDRVLLLAGYRSEVVAAYLADTGVAQRLGLEITLNVEPEPLGTGGALALAHATLDDAFLLVNGDTWFDFDWSVLAASDAHPARLALRRIALADRYETVVLDGDRVTAFQPRGAAVTDGLINGGAYRLRKAVVPTQARTLSLENDLLPDLCARGGLGGAVFEGPFIDIGVPDSFAAAQTLLA
ncbi:N/A [soil metagenome]